MPEKENEIIAKYQKMYDTHYDGLSNWLCRILRVDKWGHYFHTDEYPVFQVIEKKIKNKS
ncbi:hypothetical protein D4Q76_00575 [archaeon]|nr:MAG: hypothetical protein D4Q76_00575 [archaeon]